MTLEEVEAEIRNATFPFLGRPREGLKALDGYPPGYGFLYALEVVDFEIGGEGIDGLHRHGIWHLVLPLQQKATLLGFTWLANVLTEIIYYYDRRGQSRVRRQLPAGFFDALPPGWNKTLDQLADEFDFAKPTPAKVFAERPELFEVHGQAG